MRTLFLSVLLVACAEDAPDSFYGSPDAGAPDAAMERDHRSQGHWGGPSLPPDVTCGPGTGLGPCAPEPCGPNNCANGSGCGPCEDYTCGPGSGSGPC